jgi:cyanate lyase
LGAQDDNIKDIKPLQKLKIKTVYAVLIGIVITAILIIAALLLKDITKKKKDAAIAAAVLTPQEKALKSLNELYEAYKNESVAVKPFYYKMSEILRTYASEKYAFNALEMTTSEFFGAVKKNMPESVNVNEFKNYLKVFSLARYAGFKPSDIEIENNFKYTKNLLELL